MLAGVCMLLIAGSFSGSAAWCYSGQSRGCLSWSFKPSRVSCWDPNVIVYMLDHGVYDVVHSCLKSDDATLGI